jgi:hypothetical protein
MLGFYRTGKHNRRAKEIDDNGGNDNIYKHLTPVINNLVEKTFIFNSKSFLPKYNFK